MSNKRAGAGGAVVAGILLLAGVVLLGEDIERLLTDVEVERAHPSLANLGRVAGDAARTIKDAVGLA